MQQYGDLHCTYLWLFAELWYLCIRKSCYKMVILDYVEINQDSEYFFWLISHTLKFSEHHHGKYWRSLTL